MQRNHGQTTLEFITSVFVVSFVLALVASVLYSQWYRFACAYLVFEQTHDRLIGVKSNIPRLIGLARNNLISVEETKTSVKGHGRCRTASENVELLKLESFR
ncbi:MAG: hypothetical protein A3K03_05415 [Bdellovibrionales bacterium RIFOXYD1_FULL_44_7]|nr:MAG: hypothetical protein A3K03_05415 [Bdellovibrionales bacterium RIFOXYD1_FULL_44_7]